MFDTKKFIAQEVVQSQEFVHGKTEIINSGLPITKKMDKLQDLYRKLSNKLADALPEVNDYV